MSIPEGSDWLRVNLDHEIETITNTWSKRYNTLTTINHKESRIVVGISTANGEESMTEKEAEYLKNLLTPIAQTVVKKHNWAKDYKITINAL
jgi:hypothetical protein